MKGNFFNPFLFIAALLCTVATSGWGQINPTTQIKGVNPPAADYLLMTRGSDGKLEYKSLNYLTALLPDEVVQGNTSPSGPPSAGQGNFYLNTTTGEWYIWNGSAWVVQDGQNEVLQGTGSPSITPGANEGILYVDTTNGTLWIWNGTAWISYGLLTYENALTKTGPAVRWGGNLTQNTALNGKGAYSVTMDSTTLMTFRSRTATGTASAVFGLSSFESLGLYATLSRVANPAESSTLSLKPDVAFLRTLDSGTRGELITTDHSVQMVYIVGENTVIGSFFLDSTGHYLTQLQDKTAAETQMLYINPTTFEISKGAAPPSGSTISSYTPSTTGSGSVTVEVTATGTGITAVRSGGTLTVTIPAGVALLSARVTGSDADNDGSGNLTVTFEGPGLHGNESIATLHIPATQKVDLSAQVFGVPSPGNPYSVDDDDTVQMQVVGIGTSGAPSISMRAVGLGTNYDNYQLVFNF